jgi:hypothetical protein
LNRAVRDWSQAFFAALHVAGIDGAAAFSMELGNPLVPLVGVALAQRGPAGDAIVLPTPSVQTHFSSDSLAFWKECYLEMAALQVAAGMTPFLQFGEVQWWYFPNDGAGTAFSGMGFYDPACVADFLAAYGHAMATITSNTIAPSTVPDEVAFLSARLGAFTTSIMAFVRATYSTCRFEVLYPTDVNTSPFNQAINFPAAWSPTTLNVLKTENFGFTFGRDLDKAEASMLFGGFPATQRAHLVGIGDSTAPWQKEARSAAGKRFESVVLFALDQYCLVGYDGLGVGLRRGLRMGS